MGSPSRCAPGLYLGTFTLLKCPVPHCVSWGPNSLPRWELADKPLDYAGSNFQDRGPRSLHVRFPGA